MKKTITFFTSLIVMILMSMTVNAQVLINEQFDYPVGDSLSGHGWATHGNLGVNTILTVSGNLSYTGYCTPSGQSASLSSAGGQDINRTFTSPTSGSLYAAILINVTSATTTGDYFLAFFKATTTMSGRVFIKKDATDATKFTLGTVKASTGTPVYSNVLLSMNTTHLVVLKYTIVAGATNDVVSIFVNPSTASEGTPTVTASDITSLDLDPIGGIALRQASASSAPALTVDGLRVATTWADAIGFSGTVTSPVVTTGTTSGITSTTAICAGNITTDGGGAITAKGICYGASINPDITGTIVIVAGSATGVFTGNLTSLTAGNTYHYRAYATNSAGTAYGADSTFTTATGAVVPVVVTGVASAIATTTATVAGDVTNDGGTTLTEKGICFGITVNPDNTGTKVIVSGTSIGAFTGNLTGLTASTLYHARAYATNAIGSSYGADITFTTQVAGVPCATIAELRSKTADNSTIYQLTGEAFLTFKQTYKGQKWIQDATGAIMIYDGATTPVISTVYNIGDGITGIKGKLDRYYGLLEFVPVADPGAATSTGHVTVPTEVTAADLAAADTNTMYVNQSKLIKLVGVSFTDANGALKFSTNKKFRMTQGATTDSLFFTNFFDANYVVTATASIIPSGLGNVTGICILSKGNYYITARDKADISLLNGINEIEANTIGIYPNPNNGRFTVNVEKFNNGEIRIYSIVGSLILSQSINKANNEFDLSSNGKGLYFVQYTDTKSGKSWTEKLIVK